MEKLKSELSKAEDPSVVEREIKASLEAVRSQDTGIDPGKSGLFDSSKKEKNSGNLRYLEIELKTEEPVIKSKKERKEEYKKYSAMLQETQNQKWLEKHGRKMFVQFSDEYKKEIHEAFLSLDTDQTGEVSRDKIEDLLIGLGIAETPQEADDIIRVVDKDGSGFIEFNEFFDVIKRKDDPGKSLQIFKAITSKPSRLTM